MSRKASAPVSERQPPLIFCWILTVRMSRSVRLLSLCRYRHNHNYADVAGYPDVCVKAQVTVVAWPGSSA